MRILHLSWEYPPIVYGGLGRHVHALAEEQSAQGHEVTVVTQSEPAAPGTPGAGAPATPATAGDGDPVHPGPDITVVNGVRVVRAPRDLPVLPLDNEHLLAWVAGVEHSMTRSLVSLIGEPPPDVIHAHDWVVAHTAVTARELLQRPLVTTFHATEAGRHQGWLPAGLPRAVHSVEWWLAATSARVIACSEHMRRETSRLFDRDPALTDVIPNGIHLSDWRADPGTTAAARARYARGGPLIVFTGRIEWEKGLQTLIDAMPAIRSAVPKARLVVAGRGGMAEELRDRARAVAGKRVRFAGWLPEGELQGLTAAADVAVVPSLYEPFGLVALEAMALGTPVAVSDTGGLAEIAGAGEYAAVFEPGDPDSLATAVIAALADREGTTGRAGRASLRLAGHYTWSRIAEVTEASYRRALDQWSSSGSPAAASRAPDPPDGNLLSDLS